MNSKKIFDIKEEISSAQISIKEDDPLNVGRWDEDEKIRFIKSCLIYGNDWKKVKDFVKTRGLGQIRSHAQKFILNICKNQNKNNKEFMENLKKLEFKSKNYADLFKNDLHLLNKERFTKLEMDEIEKKIILKFKINYSKEYECLNSKSELLIESHKKEKKISVPVKKSEESRQDEEELNLNKKILLKKINYHFSQIKKLSYIYNNLEHEHDSSLKIKENSTKDNEMTVKSNNSNNVQLNSINIENELMSSSQFIECNDIFSLFNMNNTEMLCNRSYMCEDEDLL